jgi:hypothetical protein
MGAPAAAAEPPPVKEPPAEPAPAEPAGVEDAPAEDAPAEFENRAARRAKGKHSSAQHPVSGKGPHLHGRGTIPGQRQWGNRRTG